MCIPLSSQVLMHNFSTIIEKPPFLLFRLRTSVDVVVKNEKQVAHQNKIHGHSRNVICLILLSDVPKAFLYLFPLHCLCCRPAWASACVLPCVSANVCLFACVHGCESKHGLQGQI